MDKVKKTVSVVSFLAGVVLLVSGLFKAMDAGAFSALIYEYGFPRFQFLSVLIILAEVILGVLLVLKTRVRLVALLAGLMVLFFTAIYTYGLLAKGITDCGCFGRLTALGSMPVVVYVRNAILIFSFFFLWRKGGSEGVKCDALSVFILLGFSVVAAYMSGYSYTSVQQPRKQSHAVENTRIAEYWNFSADTTYLVFAFSYTCPHCMNSIANLKEYEKSGVVDKVVGLALEDSLARKSFERLFEPNFQIVDCDARLLGLTNKFPRSYVISQGRIIYESGGTLPSPYVLGNKLHSR